MHVTTSGQQEWGRVDDDGTVYVREGDDWRAVGQFPDGTAEEAMAYFQRKYTDLAGQVVLLEQRARNGAPATDVARAVNRLKAELEAPNAVGDVESLRGRVAALDTTVTELTEQQNVEAKAAVESALAERTMIVEEAEALAALDPAKVQWKQATEKLNDLFTRWQAHQQTGPKLPKSEANELWKRFRTARTSIEQHRRVFFAELDSVHRDAKSKKTSLIEQAEALIPQGVDGVPGYRDLLDEWKRSGRAGKKTDDALWARFKAAGDAIYQAKAAVDAAENEEYSANLEVKLALLEEAEPLINEKDLDAAKKALLSIQRRWDAAGKVPRDQIRPVEDRLRKVEQAVRSLEDEQWRRNNPETKARTEGLASQLGSAIEKLEAALESAKASGDARAEAEAREALETRRAWLDAIG
jgi:predicted house-cleaning noncanonical NTP pyrophosphatase (MazG superfamily)